MCVGQYFVEDEQQAQYGQAVLKNLSACLTNKYGQGWSVETLKKMSDEPNRNFTTYRTIHVACQPIFSQHSCNLTTVFVTLCQ